MKKLLEQIREGMREDIVNEIEKIGRKLDDGREEMRRQMLEIKER